MFCQTCGAEVREGLRYCNRCGANLIADKSAPPQLFAIILAISAAIVAIAIIALLVVIGFVTEILGKPGVSAEAYVFLMLMSLVFFGIEAMMIRQLSKLLNVYLQTRPDAPKSQKREMSSPQSVAQLGEAGQDTMQIPIARATNLIETENLTRKLETDE